MAHHAQRLRLELAAAMLALCLTACAPAAESQGNVPIGFRDEGVIASLSQPVGIAFLPDGRLLVVEQTTARIRLVVNGSLAATDPVGTVPGVNTSGSERGLLGIAVDPGWPGRPYLYIHATHTGSRIRISRFTATGDLDFSGNGAIAIDPASRYDLLNDIPDNAFNHNGGSVRFAMDGFLYVSLGEDASPSTAQDTSSLRGVLLRLDVSRLPAGPGSAPRDLITPADNPFVATGGLNARLLWAWGLRNPFRFHPDPATGELLIADVGQNTWEELDLADAPGLNFGWPRHEGPAVLQAGAPLTGPPVAPIYSVNHNTGAASIISAGIYRAPPGAAQPFPAEYEGNAFVSDYFAGFLRRLVRSGGTWAIAPAVPGQSGGNWGTSFGAVSDWAIGPDGSLWYCHQGGQIRRIVATGDTTPPPPPPPPEPVVQFHRPYPQPSPGDVDFTFELPRESRVDLVLHDLTGRIVKRLIVGHTYTAGPHGETWRADDEDGDPVGSGMYFAVLTVEGTRLERRVVLVR